MLDEELAAAPDTALHGDRGSHTLAAGWPMASPVFNQGRNNTANPGERSASAPGPSRPESRSNHAGIPVKCSRNRRQVRRNPQLRFSAEPKRWMRVTAPVRAALLLNRHLLHDEVSARAKMARDSTASMAPKDGITLLLSAPIVLFWLFFFVASMASSGIWTFSVAALVALHQMSLASANAALTGYFFASALGVLIGGAIADRTGRHDLLVAVALVTGAAMIAIVGALSLPMVSVVSALGIAGLMHGLIRPARDLMIRTVTPKGSIGKVFGFVTTGANLGSTVSPVLFGWMIDRGDPQGVFLLIALLMLVAVSIILAAKRLSNGIR